MSIAAILRFPNGTGGMLFGADWVRICTPLGVRDKIIQRILRHANISTTLAYYVKPADEAVKTAMAKLETSISEANQSLSDSKRRFAGIESNYPIHSIRM